MISFCSNNLACGSSAFFNIRGNCLKLRIGMILPATDGIVASGSFSSKVIKDFKKIERNTKAHDNWFWGKGP